MTKRIRLRFVAPLRPKAPPSLLSGDIAFLPMDAIGDDGNYDHESIRTADELANAGYTYFEQGDVVRARVTPCFENRKGALLASLAGGRGLGTTELFVFRPSCRIDARYLFYVTVSDDFTESGTATIYGAHGVRRVDDHFARDYRVFLPPLEAQRAIADYLDAETSRIDALIGRKQRMIELLDEWKSLLFPSALEARGFHWTPSLAYPAADQLPEEWSVAHLSVMLEQLTNGYVGPTRDLLVDDGVKYIQSLHIKDGKIDFARGRYYVPQTWHDARPRIHLRPGDVLIVQTGDIGQVAVVPPDFGPASCHALQIARVRRDWLSGEYLGMYLRSPFGRQSLLSRVTGALHPHLEGGIRDIPIVVAPLTVQHEIVNEVKERSAQVDRVRSKLAEQIALIAEHRQGLIARAVTGELEIARVAA